MSTSRDVLWERALSALPAELLSALRAAELDDPGVLSEYPREDVLTTDEKLGSGVAPWARLRPVSALLLHCT